MPRQRRTYGPAVSTSWLQGPHARSILVAARVSCLDETTVTLFLDRRLPASRASTVEGHIDSCGTCRRLLSALARGRTSDPAIVPPAIGEPPAGDVELIVGERVDRFVLLRVIGSGGMGTVYAAYDPMLDRKVALKLLRRGTASAARGARLIREAQAMARVS